MKPRVVETNQGIQGEITTEIYDRFARGMRDRGWNNVDAILASGIAGGHVLELGPGPGYVGLEWLKKAPGGTLTGCEISPDMIKIAQRNAREYGLDGRTNYVEGSVLEMPFPDDSFDAAFSNGSLHEWEDPVLVFREIARVVKPGGTFCVCDMRRDVNPLISGAIRRLATPPEMRPGFRTSLAAAYTVAELRAVLEKTPLRDADVARDFFGLRVSGRVA